jgi:hypothetical protein
MVGCKMEDSKYMWAPCYNGVGLQGNCRRLPDIEGSCGYDESAAEDSRQWVVDAVSCGNNPLTKDHAVKCYVEHWGGIYLA